MPEEQITEEFGNLPDGPSLDSIIEKDDLKKVKKQLLKRIWDLTQLLHKDMSYIEGYRDGLSEGISSLSKLICHSEESSQE